MAKLRLFFRKKFSRIRRGSFDSISGGNAVGIPPEGEYAPTYHILGF